MRRMSVSPSDEDKRVGSSSYRRQSSVLPATGVGQSSGEQAEASQIVEFYNGRSVFVTGASGFIGKLLIEKLLRACPGLRRIFVLIRARRGKQAGERFDELFNSAIFNELRRMQGGDERFNEFIRDKVCLLEGDLTEPLLGLGGEQVKLVADEVTVLLHSAAMVSFEGKLRRSICANLTGTMHVLELACRLPKLASLIHVSTCYSNCHRPGEVDEHIYPVGVEPAKILNLADCLDDELVDQMRKQLIGPHPNPYTYTKQLAEYLVGQYGLNKRLPVLICRPSIVIGTLHEPLVGFTDNRNGMNGIFWAQNRGLLRAARGLGSALVDQVPADMLVNAIIALGWFNELYHRVGTSSELLGVAPPGTGGSLLADKMRQFYTNRRAELAKKSQQEASLRAAGQEDLMRIPVCHVSSGIENPVSFEEMLAYVAEGAERYPSTGLFRKPWCLMWPNRLLFELNRFWFHTLAGRLLDCWPSLADGVAKPTNWTREFKRVDRFMSVLVYFTSNTFYFRPSTRQVLMREFMNAEDRRVFDCDTSAIDWAQFGDHIALGLRRHILNEPDESIPETRHKFRRTCWRNRSLEFVLIAALFQLLYALVLY